MGFLSEKRQTIDQQSLDVINYSNLAGVQTFMRYGKVCFLAGSWFSQIKKVLEILHPTNSL